MDELKIMLKGAGHTQCKLHDSAYIKPSEIVNKLESFMAGSRSAVLWEGEGHRSRDYKGIGHCQE